MKSWDSYYFSLRFLYHLYTILNQVDRRKWNDFIRSHLFVIIYVYHDKYHSEKH